jgi:Terminase-like family.
MSNLPLTPEQKLKKIMNQPKLYIETFMKILNKNGEIVPFKLNDMQQHIHDNSEKYTIILKARQGGGSVYCLAYALAMCCTKPNTNTLFLSHSGDSTRMIFNKAKMLYESIPDIVKPQLIRNNRNELAFTNGSVLSCATISRKDQARGSTLQFVHVSELAFSNAEYAKNQLLALEQALTSNAKIVIESTANGLSGHYYDLWQGAKNTENMYKPLFYSYLDTASMFIDEHRQALERFRNANQREFVESDLTHEEQILMKSDKRFTLGIILWRRYKIMNSDVESFNQEFPLTDTEAFLTTGKSIFDTMKIHERLIHLPTCIPKTKIGLISNVLKPYIGTTLSIYHRPEKGAKYGIGVDGGDGVGKDSSTITVLNAEGVEMAHFNSNKIAPHKFAEVVYEIGKYYNMALLVIEKASSGNIILDRLRHTYDYKNIYKHKAFDERGISKKKIGFVMSDKTRPLLIGSYREAWEEGQILVNSRIVLDEMLTFVANDKTGKIEHIQGGHDDSLISFMFALFALSQPHYV